jgi:chemotaxis protein CheY-P-specific phosphatase CheC
MDARTKARENYIVHVLNAGFNRSAQSFSQFVSRKVKVHTSQSILVRNNDDFSYITEEEGNLYVLTTQLIGDFSGKSYLILNEEECEEIFNGLHAGMSTNREQLKDALLLEIDNIISASVISELSNELQIELYGDVPILKKINARDLQDLIGSDGAVSETTSIVVTNTSFQFDNHDRVNPQFIWKLSTKIFDVIPKEKVSA